MLISTGAVFRRPIHFDTQKEARMSTSHILYELTDRVATITLNRPEVMNALGGAMREEIFARLQHAAQDLAVRCVIITGAGNAFCAGGDIANMAEMQSQNDA